MSAVRPASRPGNPCFSSGPCAKRPGWSLGSLSEAAVGRSHRAKPGKTKLAEVIERSKKILGMPEGYRLGIVPASDTGAVRSDEHTSELQSLMRISYAVFCLKKKTDKEHIFFSCSYFFCNDTATTEIYTDGHTLSLHDALPIFAFPRDPARSAPVGPWAL